jgi:ribonuclease R
MGMALNAYTNFTSPLRKYVDFLTHRQIKCVLANKPADTVTDQQLQHTASALARGRGATQAAERWLTGNYLDRCKAAGDTRFTGEVVHVSSAGFTVRLKDLGLEGQVDLRKDPEKFSFDKWTASLTSSTRKLQLGQTVEVEYQGTPDAGSGAAPQFELAPGCALKAPKE